MTRALEDGKSGKFIKLHVVRCEFAFVVGCSALGVFQGSGELAVGTESDSGIIGSVVFAGGHWV